MSVCGTDSTMPVSVTDQDMDMDMQGASKKLQASRPRGEKTQIPEFAFSPFSDTFLLLLVRMLHVSELISLP